MSKGTENAPVTVSQVNVAFQSKPMQDITSFTGKITVPGVGQTTTEKLLACDIKSPCALLGQFMVNFGSRVILATCCAFLIACASTLGVFLCTVVLQVLERDTARMQTWLKKVANIRPKEGNMIVAALDEKCRKILTV